MLDCQLFGLNAGAHHLVNLAFHVANTLLVFAVFRRMTGMVWRSAVVAALFALHPLHVESVAWLAERKDLLSAFFWLLCVWAYVLYVEKLKIQSPKSRWFYALALLMFLLGLLSKPMVVTLPFVLLLLDYWPLNRVMEFGTQSADWNTKKTREAMGRLVWEKWPFFALMVLFCFTTWYSVKLGNNFPNLHVASTSTRLANIPVSYVRYLWKTICPSKLAVLYQMPDQWAWWKVCGAIIILLVISWLVLARARPAPYLIFGWFAFLGMLVPTIGIMQVGVQAMADRYMYLPLIGLFAGSVWLLADLAARWRSGAIILGAVTTLVLVACGALSWIQVQYWHDSVSLWTHCLATGSESAIAHHDLGRAYIGMGEPEKAMEQYQAALKLDPDNRLANLSYGGALVAVGKQREATNYFARVLRSDPNYGEAHENMGLALLDLGELDGAISHFADAIRLNPSSSAAHTDMGRALSAQGKSDEAMNSFAIAVSLDPAYSAVYYYLGVEYLKRGALD